jgi:hypothetical protein
MIAPLALMVAIWGAELLRLWIHPASVGARYAAESAPLFLPFVLGMGIAIMGQYNSSTILFGMARHKWYSRGVLVEAILTVPLMIMAVKAYGIVGAAWVGAILMILDRGLWTSFVMCRVVGYSWLAYLKAIYWRPLLCALPVAALMIWLKATVLAAGRWQEFIIAGVLTGVLYSALAWFYCVFPEHRQMAINLVRQRLRRSR